MRKEFVILLLILLLPLSRADINNTNSNNLGITNYKVIVFPDLQQLSYYPNNLTEIIRWVVNEKPNYVFFVGHMAIDGNNESWINISKPIYILNDKNITYFVAKGDHGGDNSYTNKFFPNRNELIIDNNRSLVISIFPNENLSKIISNYPNYSLILISHDYSAMENFTNNLSNVLFVTAGNLYGNGIYVKNPRHPYYYFFNGHDTNENNYDVSPSYELEGMTRELTIYSNGSIFSKQYSPLSNVTYIEAYLNNFTINYSILLPNIPNPNPKAQKECEEIGRRQPNEYCSTQYKLVAQKENNMVCENNFECSSSVCYSGKCIGKGSFQKFLSWVKNLFIK